MNNTDLTGTTVLVNPLLEHDPTHNQGMVGRIEHSFIEADEMYVDFERREGGFSLYSMDALLVLKPFKELEIALFSAYYEGKEDEVNRQVAKEIDNIVRQGGHSRDALEIAKTNPVILAQATFSVQDSLELARRNEYMETKDAIMNAKNGTVVLVGANSSGLGGEIGILAQEYLFLDKYVVKFNDIQNATVSTKDLLVLKPHSELFRDILTIGKELSQEDFKVVLQVNMMQENGGPGMQKVALELLHGNPAAIEFATTTLHDKIELEIAREQEQKYSGSRQR